MDWKNLICELLEAGWTQPRLAQVCEVGQSTISLLATGKTKDPRDSLGQNLRRLHEAAKAAKVNGIEQEPAPAVERRSDHETAAAYANTLADRRAPGA